MDSDDLFYAQKFTIPFDWHFTQSYYCKAPLIGNISSCKREDADHESS